MRPAKLTIAERFRLIMLVYDAAQILNHLKALNFAVKFLGMDFCGDQSGELLVRRMWYHRECCGIDPQQWRRDLSLVLSFSINLGSSFGPKVGKVVHFECITTCLEIDVSKSVGKCLVGSAVVPTPHLMSQR